MTYLHINAINNQKLFILAITIPEANKRPCAPGCQWLVDVQAFQKKKILHVFGLIQLTYDWKDTVKWWSRVGLVNYPSIYSSTFTNVRFWNGQKIIIKCRWGDGGHDCGALMEVQGEKPLKYFEGIWRVHKQLKI